MKRIDSLLDKLLTKKHFYIKIKGNLALLKWDELVGEKLARFTTPLYYKEGVLYIGVVSSIFMRELTFMKEMILKKIKENVGEAPINDIKFRVIEKNRIRHRKKYIPDSVEMDFSNITLSPSDLNWIEALSMKLNADDKTRNKYRQLLTFYKKNEKLRESMGYKKCKRCGVLFKGRGDLCPICQLKDKQPR